MFYIYALGFIVMLWWISHWNHRSDNDALQHLVCEAIENLGADANGYNIWQWLRTKRERDISIGTLYAVFEQLEESGVVISRRVENAPSGIGPRVQKFYRLSR